jgi:hypothetical protein
MAIVLSHQPPMPLDACFTHRCPNKASLIVVVEGAAGFSLMCDVCRDNYQNRFTLVGVTVEPYTPERAAELDSLVRATYADRN